MHQSLGRFWIGDFEGEGIGSDDFAFKALDFQRNWWRNDRHSYAGSQRAPNRARRGEGRHQRDAIDRLRRRQLGSDQRTHRKKKMNGRLDLMRFCRAVYQNAIPHLKGNIHL